MKHYALPMLLLPLLAACQPTVKVEAPDKPIVINMNVNISHEVRVKVDRDLDKTVFAKDSPLF
ncbi:MAG: YnbE family lipoprotein [Azospirillum brasilense]|nr:MAG: YnbE family lipoprotein [Azospirillum brasilense]